MSDRQPLKVPDGAVFTIPMEAIIHPLDGAVKKKTRGEGDQGRTCGSMLLYRPD
jgi:hypothetical protein